MKNLSKVLALVLALVMALGMIATADFTDVPADNQYKTAIDVLSSLDILGGYPDGSYKPNKEVNRAEAATMLYRSFAGKALATIYDGPTKFSDVAADNWASGYINYGATTNMIGGYPDGQFKPEKNVTLNEFVKMVLGGLGHDVNDFAKCLILAAENGLLDNLPDDLKADTALTRGMCAQIVYNALFSAYLKFPYQVVDKDTGILTTAYPTLGGKVFGFETMDGVVVAFNNKVGIGEKGTEGYVTVQEGETKRTFKVKAGMDFYDQIGQSVKVTYKAVSSNGVYNTLYGITNNVNKVVSAWTDTLPEEKDGVRTIDGVKIDSSVPAYVLGGVSGTNNIFERIERTPSQTPAVYKDYKEIMEAGHYYNLQAIDSNNDGKAEMIFVREFKLGTVGAYGDGKITISGVEVKIADMSKAELEGAIAKDAYVLYSKVGTELLAKALEVETAAFTGIKGNNEAFKLGGEYRSALGIAGGNIDVLKSDNFNGTMNYILLNGKVIFASLKGQSYIAKDYIWVNAILKTVTTDPWTAAQNVKFMANVVREDGTTAQIEVHKDSANLPTDGLKTLTGDDRLMTYSMKEGLVLLDSSVSAGSSYEDVLTGNHALKKVGTQFIANSTIFSADDNTVFFVEVTNTKGEKSIVAYTAATVPSDINVSKMVVTKDAPIKKLVAVIGSITQSVGNEMSRPVLVTGFEMFKDGNDTKYTYSAIDLLNGCAPISITLASESAKEAGLYTYTENNAGPVSLTNRLNNWNGNATFSADAVNPFVFSDLSGANTAELVSDSKIVVINKDHNGATVGTSADIKNGWKGIIQLKLKPNTDMNDGANGNGIYDINYVIVFAQ